MLYSLPQFSPWTAAHSSVSARRPGPGCWRKCWRSPSTRTKSAVTHTTMPTRWLKKTEQVLERKLLEDSSDGMKGLASGNSNMLNNYKPTINIKNRDVIAASREAANFISTNASTVEPEITTNSDAQDKANGQNVSTSQKLMSRKGSQRESPISSAKTSQTPSCRRRTTET